MRSPGQNGAELEFKENTDAGLNSQIEGELIKQTFAGFRGLSHQKRRLESLLFVLVFCTEEKQQTFCM